MRLISSLVLAAVTAGAWAAWLSWENGYHTDAAGATSGPYAWWQVAGAVVTLAVIAVLAARRLHPLLIAPVMAVAFAVAWSVGAVTSDDSGLWPIGATLVLFGVLGGAALVSAVGRVLQHRSR